MVDVCEESVDVNCVEFAGFLALVTSDTANFTDTHYVFTFVVVVASDGVSKVVWYEFN